MGDSSEGPSLRRNSEAANVSMNHSKMVSKKCLVASGPMSFSHKSFKRITSLSRVKFGKGTTADVVLFLLKIAALETARRLSKTRCSFLWSGVQVLQLLCFPPFKWIDRWNPFRFLVRGMQMLSRPLLVLSIATAFSDQSECRNHASDDTDGSHGLNDSHTDPETHSDVPSVQSTPDTRMSDEASQSLLSTNWLHELYAELENEGINIHERINEDELYRFYSAANGEFACLLSSVKKAIHWRENYRILSGQELEMWSNMVFWHGYDVKHRPCLIIRLGKCINLSFEDRPRFAQAIVSQVEHGILQLVNEDPQITVLVDCEGLSLRFPMQMMRSCSAILKDNFPNRLGCLYVIRLPPVVRVLAQTFFQVLKPSTRQKLKIEGRIYRKVLSENLQMLPSYLGGVCTCTRCSSLSIHDTRPSIDEERNKKKTDAHSNSSEDLSSLHRSGQADIDMNSNCDHVLRSAIVCILIFWVLITLISGIYDPESRPSLHL